MKVETFKCATGSGWGILVDEMFDTDLGYAKSEKAAVERANFFYTNLPKVLTTEDPEHYSNKAS